MNLALILCAFAWHRWTYFCADSRAARDTARECLRCGAYQERSSDALGRPVIWRKPEC
jgi:hypothetical protein